MTILALSARRRRVEALRGDWLPSRRRRRRRLAAALRSALLLRAIALPLSRLGRHYRRTIGRWRSWKRLAFLARRLRTLRGRCRKRRSSGRRGDASSGRWCLSVLRWLRMVHGFGLLLVFIIGPPPLAGEYRASSGGAATPATSAATATTARRMVVADGTSGCRRDRGDRGGRGSGRGGRRSGRSRTTRRRGTRGKLLLLLLLWRAVLLVLPLLLLSRGLLLSLACRVCLLLLRVLRLACQCRRVSGSGPLLLLLFGLVLGRLGRSHDGRAAWRDDRRRVAGGVTHGGRGRVRVRARVCASALSGLCLQVERRVHTPFSRADWGKSSSEARETSPAHQATPATRRTDRHACLRPPLARVPARPISRAPTFQRRVCQSRQRRSIFALPGPLPKLASPRPPVLEVRTHVSASVALVPVGVHRCLPVSGRRSALPIARAIFIALLLRTGRLEDSCSTLPADVCMCVRWREPTPRVSASALQPAS